MATRKVTDAQVREIVKLRKLGKNYLEIADTVGVNYSVVGYWLYKEKYGHYQKKYEPTNGATRPVGRPRLTPTQKLARANYPALGDTTPVGATGVGSVAATITRPMIALVGTPAEVTATIRELFS